MEYSVDDGVAHVRFTPSGPANVVSVEFSRDLRDVMLEIEFDADRDRVTALVDGSVVREVDPRTFVREPPASAGEPVKFMRGEFVDAIRAGVWGTRGIMVDIRRIEFEVGPAG